MLSLYMIFVVLVGHFMADFYCQSDKMAKGKSTSILWLTLHVLTYTLVMMMFVVFFLVFGPEKALVWAGINGVLHWVTDYYTSRVSSRMWKEGRVHDFFVVIGLDQLIHYVTLFTTLLLVVKY